MGLAATCVAVFVGLAWARVELLTAMMPWAVNLGLGVLAGLLGNSLGYWVGALGATPPRACVVSQSLKLAQIVGVPAAYLLLGGHLLALPLLGAALALAGVVWAHRTGRSCISHPSLPDDLLTNRMRMVELRCYSASPFGGSKGW